MARKILLADDSVTAQNMGRKILADAGYEVIAVNNGSAALKKIAELKPDLVILDVYMPGYSGLEVCQRLKESQETARIPVLLSVGKLEPFKPEEAQRVRADGFIVKPFEASELLSALSKLEDKVVPRAEPTKPGRFARAMAAAEEADRGGRNAAANDESGWKSRIGFPKEKTEIEEKVGDDAPMYNPVNRDLRTMVAKPTAEKKEEARQSAAEAVEPSVDVAAMVPSGLPNDVTPEEVAAIAAAVAQIQMATAASHDVENPVSEIKAAETSSSETKSGPSFEPATGHFEDSLQPGVSVQDGPAPPSQGDAHADARGESKINDLSTEAAVSQTAPATLAEQENDLPVTMAATAESVAAVSEGASCWMAVPVALESDEAGISLEQEMQKAHATLVAAEADSVGFATVPQVPAPPAENSSARAEAAAEVPISNPAPEPAMNAEVPDVGPVSMAQSEGSTPAPSFVDTAPAALPEPASTSSEQAGDRVPESMTIEAVPVQADAEISPAARFAESHQEQEPTPTEFVSPATEVADPGVLAAQTLQPAEEAEPAIAEASTAFAPIVRAEERAEEHSAEIKLDPETVKSTAAAWASWRQIRDSGDANPGAAEAQPADSAAMAVAAGAEQVLQEPSIAPEDKPSDVASIVDSVLADLRPKLMAEISRKMAEKK